MKESNSNMLESNCKMYESSSQSTRTLEQGFMMESNVFQQFKDTDEEFL